MHLNIKNGEAHQLAVELSAITGESLTATVTSALRAQLARERRLRSRAGVAEKLMEIGSRYAALPDGSASSPDGIVGYDESGAPQ